MTTISAPDRPETTTSLPTGIPFGRLVRVEWRKATDTRAARWLLALAALATVGLELAPLLAPDSIDQSVARYLQFTGFGLTTLLPVVVILTLTTEWTQRTVLTTFAQEPRRHRVIEAKVAVSLLMAAVAIVFAAVVTAAAVGIAAAVGRSLDDNLGAAVIVGYVLFVLVNIGMGVAFGALLHNTAAAVVLFFVLPVVLGIVGSFNDVVNDWLNMGNTFGYLSDGQFDGHVPNIVVSVLVWVALPLVAGIVRTTRREIN